MMAKAIELTSVDHLVKDSELAVKGDAIRKFEYKLNDNAAKGKLIKGGKRAPFGIVENSSSCNLIFNLGSWNNIVLPFLKYWNELKGTKTCRVDDTVIRIGDVKTGEELGGKHIDTQVVIFSNRDKVCCTATIQHN